MGRGYLPSRLERTPHFCTRDGIVDTGYSEWGGACNLHPHQSGLISPVLGIRNIYVRIRIRIPGPIPLTNGSGSGSDPALDPTPFFIDFKDAKKCFLLITCPQAHYLQS
jgi:hypothetical protein